MRRGRGPCSRSAGSRRARSGTASCMSLRPTGWAHISCSTRPATPPSGPICGDDDPPPGPPAAQPSVTILDEKSRFNIWHVVIALFAVMILQNFLYERRTVETIPYSALQHLAEQGLVTEVEVGETHIRGTFREPQDGKSAFVTTRVDPEIARALAEDGVTVIGVVESN